jgi:hypothetical protein
MRGGFAAGPVSVRREADVAKKPFSAPAGAVAKPGTDRKPRGFPDRNRTEPGISSPWSSRKRVHSKRLVVDPETALFHAKEQ